MIDTFDFSKIIQKTIISVIKSAIDFTGKSAIDSTGKSAINFTVGGRVMAIFLLVFGTVFVAEMGDKTQLLLVAMAGKYKVSQILTGTWLATVLLNVLAVAVGAALSNYLDMRIIKTIAGIAFFWFALSSLSEDDDDEELKEGQKKGIASILAIFGTFFIGELGDKTQLAAITLAASYTKGSFANAFAVFGGSTLALIAADFIGLIAGLFLKSKMPTSLLNKISCIIFAIFGAVSIREAGKLIFTSSAAASWLIMAASVIIFAILAILKIKKISAASGESSSKE